MTEQRTEADIEQQLSTTLESAIGNPIRHVQVDGQSLELFFGGTQADAKRLKIAIRAPWRLVQDGEVVLGSADAARAGMNSMKQAEIGKRCQVLRDKKVQSFELLDFNLELSDDLSIEHFATATSEDEQDYFVAIDDTRNGKALFQLGFGWIAQPE